MTTSQASTSVHVACIMDGNGRWAKQRGLPRTAGHTAGEEAIRRLVGLGLEYLPPAPTRTKKKTAARASEMAGSMIDWLSDKSAPAEERAKRKRRLVKGPEEFREIRSDLPKPKR